MSTQIAPADETMCQEPLPLDQQVEQLGVYDWRVVLAAHAVLVEAGEAGLQAVIQGLSHSHPRVRRACAQFMDHEGSDPCVDALLQAARHDPVPAVRRFAVHSLSCQRCKVTPLSVDGVAVLIERALSDPSISVRREAVFGLTLQLPDLRAVVALKTILSGESDRKLLCLARLALKRHDPEYRQATIEQSKARARAEYERRANQPKSEA
jgi:HEAT repeat protein